jgi:trimethylamine--corrinoid protein Co-methyltransferase
MEPGPIPTFKPRLKVLNRRQALAIHTAALEILEKIGIKMEHAESLEMLAGAGGSVFDKDWIRLPAYLAEEAI